MQKLVCALIVCLSTTAAVAQQPAPAPAPAPEPTRAPLVREGFWFSGGLGLGSVGCQDCEGERWNGLSGGLSLGGTISPKFLLGIGTSGFSRTIDGETVSVGTLDTRIRFYPSNYHGFHINGGIGLGSLSIDGESEFGAGVMFGVGWDIRVGRNWSLTPFYNGFAMASESADANVGQLGLAVTIH